VCANCVIDPASLQVDRRAADEPRRIGSMRADARALIRYRAGEPDACSVVRVPSVEEEDAKRLHRERHRLVASAFSTSTHQVAVCAAGIYDYQPLRPDRMERLDHLRTGNGQALPVRLRPDLSGA